MVNNISTAINSFSSSAWPYINHSVKVARNGLTVTRLAIVELTDTLKKPIAGLGMLNAVATVISLNDLYYNTNDLYTSIHLDKVKWICWTTAKTITNALDVVESFGSTLKALAVFDLVAQPLWYTALEFNLIMAMSGYSISRSVYDLHRLNKFKAKLLQNQNDNGKIERIFQKAVKNMRKTKRDIGLAASEHIYRARSIQLVVEEIDHRRNMTYIGLAANTALTGALVATSFFSMPGVVPVIAIARSAAMIYKHYNT